MTDSDRRQAGADLQGLAALGEGRGVERDCPARGASVVDPDDISTWPGPLRERVERLAAELAGTADHYEDLELYDQEDDFPRLLDGHLVRAWHCTRLLDHEAAAIRAQGLRALTPALITDRLDQAHSQGYITHTEYAELQANDMLVGHSLGRRAGQVCLILSTAAMTYDVDAIHRLLTTWGGEGIYWRHADQPSSLRDTLARIGRPAVVAAHLDLSRPSEHAVFRSLAHLFVARAIGVAEASAEVLHRADVSADHIEGVFFSGDAAYDRFALLPRL